jgi:hypothetical protein
MNCNANQIPEPEQEREAGSDYELHTFEPPNTPNKHSPKAAIAVESPKPVIASFDRIVKKQNRIDL